MIVETIEVNLQITGEIRIPIIEPIRQKDESQIAIIDKIRRAIGTIETPFLTKRDRIMTGTILHTGGIQVTIATSLRTGETITVITMTDQTIATVKIDDMIATLVMNRTDDITHRMTNEVHPRTKGTTITIPIQNAVRAHTGLHRTQTLSLCQNRDNPLDQDLQVQTQVRHT